MFLQWVPNISHAYWENVFLIKQNKTYIYYTYPITITSTKYIQWFQILPIFIALYDVNKLYGIKYLLFIFSPIIYFVCPGEAAKWLLWSLRNLFLGKKKFFSIHFLCSQSRWNLKYFWTWLIASNGSFDG